MCVIRKMVNWPMSLAQIRAAQHQLWRQNNIFCSARFVVMREPQVASSESQGVIE